MGISSVIRYLQVLERPFDGIKNVSIVDIGKSVLAIVKSIYARSACIVLVLWR